MIGPNTVGIMLEPIQGEGGVWPATHAFMQQLRELTHKHGLLLIVDEIQTGIGRLGTMFAYEQSGIEPDIMVLGKGIGGGVPLAAPARNRRGLVLRAWRRQHLNGSPLMCAAGLAIVRTVNEPQFLQTVVRNGQLLGSELQKLSARHGLGGVRGTGLLQALDLKRPVGATIVNEARDAGLLVDFATAELAALHAGAERQPRRDRRNDRNSRWCADRNGCGAMRRIAGA